MPSILGCLLPLWLWYEIISPCQYTHENLFSQMHRELQRACIETKGKTNNEETGQPSQKGEGENLGVS